MSSVQSPPPPTGSSVEASSQMTNPRSSSIQERIWLHPWTSAEMRENASDWSLAGDAGLLLNLEQFSNQLIQRADAIQQHINQTVTAVKTTQTRLENSLNEFMALANTQFIENCVYDEDPQDTQNTKATKTDESEKSSSNTAEAQEKLFQRYVEAVQIGLSMLDTHFDRVDPKLADEDASSDEEDENGGRMMMEPILEPKDRYILRPLPYLIGTTEFMTHDDIGIGERLNDGEKYDDAPRSESLDDDLSGDQESLNSFEQSQGTHPAPPPPAPPAPGSVSTSHIPAPPPASTDRYDMDDDSDDDQDPFNTKKTKEGQVATAPPPKVQPAPAPRVVYDTDTSEDGSESSFFGAQTKTSERKVIDTNENKEEEQPEEPIENVPPSIPANPMLSALEQAIRKRQEKLLKESSSPKSIDDDDEETTTNLKANQPISVNNPKTDTKPKEDEQKKISKLPPVESTVAKNPKSIFGFSADQKNKDSDQESDEDILGKPKVSTTKTTSTLKGNNSSKFLPSSESDDDFGIGSSSITTKPIQQVKENKPVETKSVATPANSTDKNKPLTNNKKPSSNVFDLDDDETDDIDLFKPVPVSQPKITAPTNPIVEPAKPSSSDKTENKTKSSIIPQRKKSLHLSSDEDEPFESKPSKAPEKISSTPVINKPVADVNSSNITTSRKAKDPLFDESDSDETPFGQKKTVTSVPAPTVQQPTPVTSLSNQESNEKKPAVPVNDQKKNSDSDSDSDFPPKRKQNSAALKEGEKPDVKKIASQLTFNKGPLKAEVNQPKPKPVIEDSSEQSDDEKISRVKQGTTPTVVVKKPANPLSDSTDDEQDQALFGKKPPVRNQTKPETVTSNVQEPKSTGSTVKDITSSIKIPVRSPQSIGTTESVVKEQKDSSETLKKTDDDSFDVKPSAATDKTIQALKDRATIARKDRTPPTRKPRSSAATSAAATTDFGAGDQNDLFNTAPISQTVVPKAPVTGLKNAATTNALKEKKTFSLFDSDDSDTEALLFSSKKKQKQSTTPKPETKTETTIKVAEKKSTALFDDDFLLSRPTKKTTKKEDFEDIFADDKTKSARVNKAKKDWSILDSTKNIGAEAAVPRETTSSGASNSTSTTTSKKQSNKDFDDIFDDPLSVRSKN